MLINLTNHPINLWQADQRNEAERLYGGIIIDIPFPVIEPDWDKQMITETAIEYLTKCQLKLSDNQHDVIHIMGEMTFTFTFVKLALEQGIKCIASTTRRNVSINANGEKISSFEFVKFREY